jgi:hypothetical protein
MPTHKEVRKGDQTTNAIHKYCRKFFSNIGGHITNPMFFVEFEKIGAEFNLKFDKPCDITDLSFIKIPKTVVPFVSQKEMREFYLKHHATQLEGEKDGVVEE